jgi:membrane protease YdiL (CAAX protease family)
MRVNSTTPLQLFEREAMNHHLRASILLTIAVALTVTVNFLNQPAPVTDSQRSDELRSTMVVQYLAYKGAEIGNYPQLKNYINDFVEGEDYDLEFVKTAALIAGIEGDPGYANELLACLPESDPHLHMLDYGLGYGGYLPPDWEDFITNNWFGYRLGILIYKQIGIESEAIDWVFKLRQLENEATTFGSIQTFFYISGMIGLGLMISMFFSARFFKKYGYPYFLLGPLRISRALLYEFASLMLFSVMFVGAIASAITLKLDVVWQITVFYLSLVAAGYLIVRQFLLKGKDTGKIAKIIGLHNLRMRVSVALHICGGLMMCIGMYLITIHLQSFFWPYDRIMQLDVPAIMANPLHATFFVAISCVMAPIFEEIIYRGLIFRGTLSTSPAWVAVLFSSFLFALPHPMPAWPITFMLGIILALIYYRTANLLVCIWTHAAWNILVLLLSMSHISL